VLPEGVGNNQSKAQGVKSKNPFFQKFLLLFSYRVMRIGNRESRTFSPQSRIFALLIRGRYYLKYYEKKQKFI
jgi:hypothetical protein